MKSAINCCHCICISKRVLLIKLITEYFKHNRPYDWSTVNWELLPLLDMQLPPLFNMPKSQLQCYGEAVYCTGEDYLSKCTRGKSSLERFTSVVAWSISTTRPAIFGQAPFNPILGETHHVSRGSLNLLLEQVTSWFCSSVGYLIFLIPYLCGCTESLSWHIYILKTYTLIKLIHWLISSLLNRSYPSSTNI